MIINFCLKTLTLRMCIENQKNQKDNSVYLQTEFSLKWLSEKAF